MILRLDRLEQALGVKDVSRLMTAGLLIAAAPKGDRLTHLRTVRPPSSWPRWAREVWSRRNRIDN